MSSLSYQDFDFDDQMKQHKLKAPYNKGITVIAYFMEGCGWCERFKPEFEKAAKESKDAIFKQVYITDSDGMNIQRKINQMNKDYLINGVPKVVGYKDGKFYAVYAKGNPDTFRTKGDMLNFAKGIKENVPVEVSYEESI